jgi:hypothetical protein
VIEINSSPIDNWDLSNLKITDGIGIKMIGKNRYSPVKISEYVVPLNPRSSTT